MWRLRRGGRGEQEVAREQEVAHGAEEGSPETLFQLAAVQLALFAPGWAGGVLASSSLPGALEGRSSLLDQVGCRTIDSKYTAPKEQFLPEGVVSK